MSLFGLHILNDKQVAALKNAGHQVEAYAVSEAAKSVLVLKTTDIGSVVAADIAAVESKTLTGPQKFEQVVVNTAPLVLKYLTGGGVSAAISDVESIARALVQSVFNDTKSTTAGKIGAEILKVAGVA